MSGERAVYPQDVLIPPKGNGQLSPITRYNAEVVRREYFTYVTDFGPISRGQEFSNVIPLRPEGDFWLTSINSMMLLPNGNNFVGDLLCQITDTRTGYNFYRPYASMRAVGSSQLGGVFSRAQDINEPYCFIRGGSIRVTLTSPNRLGNITVGSTYFVLNGWMEYENAAY